MRGGALHDPPIILWRLLLHRAAVWGFAVTRALHIALEAAAAFTPLAVLIVALSLGAAG
jgi:hypothetical protein